MCHIDRHGAGQVLLAPMRSTQGAVLNLTELGPWEAVQLDKELLKAEVRPAVQEDVRLRADDETRLLLANLKVRCIVMRQSLLPVSLLSAVQCQSQHQEVPCYRRKDLHCHAFRFPLAEGFP